MKVSDDFPSDLVRDGSFGLKFSTIDQAVGAFSDILKFQVMLSPSKWVWVKIGYPNNWLILIYIYNRLKSMVWLILIYIYIWSASLKTLTQTQIWCDLS